MPTHDIDVYLDIKVSRVINGFVITINGHDRYIARTMKEVGQILLQIEKDYK